MTDDEGAAVQNLLVQKPLNAVEPKHNQCGYRVAANCVFLLHTKNITLDWIVNLAFAMKVCLTFVHRQGEILIKVALEVEYVPI